MGEGALARRGEEALYLGRMFGAVAGRLDDIDDLIFLHVSKLAYLSAASCLVIVAPFTGRSCFSTQEHSFPPHLSIQ
jgi:hypothetical protein